MRGVINQHRLLGRLLATIAASALTGTACSGASFEENADGAAGAGDDEGGSGAVGGTSSGGGSAGDAPLGGTGNVGQGGASGDTNLGGTGAYAGDAIDGGTAGTGQGGTFGGAGASTGGVAGSVAGSGGTVAGNGGAGGGPSCGCPMKCFEWNAVPQNMGGAGGASSARIIAAGAPAAGTGSGAPLPCPPASVVSMGAVCGGTTPPPTAGPVVTGPTFSGTTCCYAVVASCASGGGAGVPGRPFLVGCEARVAAVAERDDWTRPTSKTPELSESARERLARAWLDDALLEHASVAAFARFTLELLALGAPPDLVQASGLAALDEIEHARLCFAAASRYAGRSLGPGKLDVQHAVDRTNLVAFALRTFEEGCVGETLGALLAGEALERASDPFVRSVLERIVPDETRHAELAWRAVHWAISSGGPEVVQALERALAALVERESFAASCTDDAHDETAGDDGWHAHGRLTPSESRTLRRQGLLGVVIPCYEALRARFDCPPRSTPASRPENTPERSFAVRAEG